MKKFRQEKQTKILELYHLTDENYVINNQAAESVRILKTPHKLISYIVLYYIISLNP